MPERILTNTVTIDKSTQDIEQELHTIFKGEIIRWAIVSVENDKMKICCSYKK